MRPLPLLVFALGLAVSVHAETTYTAKHIKFNNPGPFTQQQLEDASGMHAGSPANAETLTAAAQKLTDTGYFDDIGANLDGSATNVTAVFNLKPTPLAQLLPVGFENLIWLTHDEIEAALHAKFPLFIDYLPEDDARAVAVDAVLIQALVAKGITAKVAHETVEPTLIHPLRSLEFRVVNPVPVVANIKLTGVSPDLKPLVQQSVNATAKTRYNNGLSGTLTSESLLDPLLDAGYIQAKLSGLSIEPQPPAGSVTPIVLSAQLEAGDIYHLSAITFAGSPLLSADAFAGTAKLHPGDIASHKALLETLAPLDDAYRSKGYMDVIIKADPTLNASTHEVAYTITVIPGEQYHLKQATTQGLDSAAQADFDKYFLIKPGDLYNPLYVSSFIEKNTSLKSLESYSGTFKAYADPNTHTVDVVITFFSGKTLRQSVTAH